MEAVSIYGENIVEFCTEHEEHAYKPSHQPSFHATVSKRKKATTIQ